MNMRFWLLAFAMPKRNAAQVLTTSPIKVRTLGLMGESASQRTMVSRRTPQARPKAEVQEAVMPGTADWRVSFARPTLFHALLAGAKSGQFRGAMGRQRIPQRFAVRNDNGTGYACASLGSPPTSS